MGDICGVAACMICCLIVYDDKWCMCRCMEVLTYCTVTKYGYVTKMQLFVRMEEKPIFRMKECINYNPAVMSLCTLAYTDHSPSSTLKYHRNPIL